MGKSSRLLVLELARMYQLETLESFFQNFIISGLNFSDYFDLHGDYENNKTVGLAGIHCWLARWRSTLNRRAENHDLEVLKLETENQMQERFEAVASS